MGKKRSSKQEARNALLAALVESITEAEVGLLKVEVEAELEDEDLERLRDAGFKAGRDGVLRLTL